MRYVNCRCMISRLIVIDFLSSFSLRICAMTFIAMSLGGISIRYFGGYGDTADFFRGCLLLFPCLVLLKVWRIVYYTMSKRVRLRSTYWYMQSSIPIRHAVKIFHISLYTSSSTKVQMK
jgi:hypothetical protein